MPTTVSTLSSRMKTMSMLGSGGERREGIEGPAGSERSLPRFAGGEAQGAGVGDHGAVIGAELGPRIEDLAAEIRGELLQAFPQALVRAHAARHHQAALTGLLQGEPALDGEGVHHCVFEGACDIRAGGVVLRRVLQGDQYRGLESAETEVESGPVRHGPRQLEAAGLA